MLAKLRSGTRPLYIEKGRYEGKKLESGLVLFVRLMRLKIKSILLLTTMVILQKELIFSLIFVTMCLIFL